SKYKVRYSCNKPVVAKVITNASTFEISPDVAELKDMVKALLLDKKSQNQSPAPVKAVEESCVTFGDGHSYRSCPATDGNVYRDNIQEFVSQASVVNYNQGNTSHRPPINANQIRPPGFPPVPNNQNAQLNQRNNQNSYEALAPQTQGVSKEDFSVYIKANDVVIRNMQTQGQNMQNQLTNLTDLITKFVNSNSASTSSSASPSLLPKVVENKSEVTKDTVNPTNNGSTEYVQPQVVQSESLISEPVTSPISEPVIAPVSASKPNLKSSIPYPSRRNDERNREKANNQIEKFYQIFKDMSFEISFANALILMPKFASTLKALIGNKEKLSEMARTPLNEHCSALADRLISRPIGVAEDVYVKVGSFHFPADFVVVDFNADPRVPLILEISFLKTRRAIIDVFEGSSGNNDFLLEEVNAFLAIEDEPTSPEFYQPYLDPEGDILLLEAFLNDNRSVLHGIYIKYNNITYIIHTTNPSFLGKGQKEVDSIIPGRSIEVVPGSNPQRGCN
nr:hypothetical protein [Tanacetum cinerariifolium]